MPITRIFWDGTSNQDIHVLRGQSTRDLTVDDLQFTDDNGDDQSAHDYLAANNDVTLTFAVVPPPAANVFANQSIVVGAGTGEVNLVNAVAPPSQPTARTNNFIIEVTARDPAAAPDHPPIDTDTIRVHIHNAVTDLVLSPATLTVRPAASTRTEPETTHYRFTLRARFDDRTMGDLTENHGATWSSTPPDHVDPDSGDLIIAPGDAEGDAITITATLPAALGGGTQTATMRIGRAWHDDPDVPVTSIIVGGGWPGTTLPDTAPNILFIGDGYIAADEGACSSTVTTMVHHLKTDRLLRPYDLLSTSMNFWRTFVPATTRGISFRCEVYDKGAGAGRPVPSPRRPPTDGKWNAANLIYTVGLPVWDDRNKPPLELFHEWESLVGPLPRDRIPPGAITRWKHIASRAFIEELDNFPGMSFGDPPAANRRNDDVPELRLHPFRCGRDGLNSFLAALQSVSGVQIGPGARLGAAWATPPLREDTTDYALKDIIRIDGNPGVIFLCTTEGISDLDEPADYADAEAGATVADGTAVFTAFRPVFNNNNFVVVLSSFPAGRAKNAGAHGDVARYIATTTSSGIDDIPLSSPVGTVGFVLDFTEVAEDAELDACRVTAHELGHSFGLGDEYVSHERAYPHDQDDLSTRVNLQTEDDVTLNGQFVGNLIRWNWHRVRKAAVVRDAITEVTPGAFRVPVVRGHPARFSKDDTVLLRLRVPGQLLGEAIEVDVSGALQIAVAPSVAASADYLVVQAAPGVTVTLAQLQTYTPGSLLFAPVPAPASVRTADYPFAEMIAKNVKDLIKAAPLYRRPTGAALTQQVKDDEDIQHPKLDGLTPGLPGRPFCFRVQPKIVGLYEGGAQYATKIFHPTGTCMMRNPHVDSNEFCAVCRYVMVDLIDPLKHLEIDRDYDDIYPLK